MTNAPPPATSQPGAVAKLYDVFISYNPADAAWVTGWLVPRFKQGGLQVAIDEESFQPGAPVLEEIERCIAASHKTAVVLTPEWVADQANVFESLLVQHADPGARVRQLIPLLLRPCTPPRRIQLLQWVDFTDAARQEAQVKRVINAIQGAAELPELHPERALPDAVQRTWELRWLWAVGLVASVTLALLGWWIWSQRPPATMDAEKYGIAVAAFEVLDDAGTPVASDLGQQIASRIAGFIANEGAQLAEIMQSPVQVWGDSPKVAAVAAGQAASRAEALAADVLIYGTLRPSNRGWQAAPQFFLDERVVSEQAAELVGEHALGTPLDLTPGDRAAEGAFTAAMRARTRALTRLLMGLAYYATGTGDGYGQAAAIFRMAANDPEWGAASTPSGQEVLYLFLGNALLKQAGLAGDPDRRSTLLNESDQAFQTALGYRPNYARIYNGRGDVYFQQAQSITESDECLRWDWDMLVRAQDAYRQALAMPEASKPAAGNVDLRAHLGLGRTLYYQGLCLTTDLEPQAWTEAAQHHAAVLDLYAATPAQSLRMPAVLAYLDLGDMALNQANWRLAEDNGDAEATVLLSQAVAHYQQALALLPAPLTEELMRLAARAQEFQLMAQCWSGRQDAAATSLEDFLAAYAPGEATAQALQATFEEHCAPAAGS